jgi:alanyl-tRNA synthetase
VALRVIADHVRSAVMLIGDGVLPGNEGRGYVLRRILRRSIRNLRVLAGGHRGGAGATPATGERFMPELTSVALEAMGELYPELRSVAANIRTVIDGEEAAFASTLRTGTAIFDASVEENRRRGTDTLSGAQAFQLHDTYGFPIDLTLEMAAEQGLNVDEDGFRRLMSEQRERAKRDAAEKKTGNADITAFAEMLERSGAVTFTGYDQISGEATVLGLLVNGVPVPSAGAGTEVDLVLDRTPFYAEGGGQHDPGNRRRVRGPRRAGPAARPHRAPRPGQLRRDHGGCAGVRRDRRRAPPGAVQVAHCDAPGAPGAAQCAGRVGGAGGLGELARPAALRLHRAGRGAGLGAARHRG